MSKEPNQRLLKLDAIVICAKRNKRSTFIGFMCGALLGLLFQTLCAVAAGLGGRALWLDYKYLGEVSIWPKRGTEVLVILSVAATIFYGVRLYGFGKRVLYSWSAGLLSAVGIIWFLASAVAFSLFNQTSNQMYLFLIGFGLLGILVEAYRDSHIVDTSHTEKEGDPDLPISSDDEDIVGRGAIVDSIVRAVVGDQTPVIALTGGFGDGKTSVLNLVTNRLEEMKDIVVVRFSAWLPMDEETLIFTLFNSVIEKIKERLFLPNSKKSIEDITRTLFAVMPGIPGSAKDLFEKPSQSDQIGSLQRSLASLPMKVVILLDDMDRMNGTQLDALLKLIRGVSHVRSFSYVCACDLPSLSQILHQHHTCEDKGEALRFLEKFFPEQIALPKIEEPILALEFEKRFYAICDRRKLLVDLVERQKFADDFKVLWQMYFRGYFTNLRRIKLLANRLNRSLSLVGEEINLRDFVLLEAVRTISPVVYEDIFWNARYFMFVRWRTATTLQLASIDDDQETAMRVNYFNVLFKGLARPPEGILLGLMKELFPYVEYYLSSRAVPENVSKGEEKGERERRIYHPDFFPRYFILRSPQDLFGEKALADFIQKINAKSEVAECARVFKATYEGLNSLPMKRLDFLHRVEISLGKFSEPATRAFPVVISEISAGFDKDPSKTLDEITSRRIVMAAADRLHPTVGVQNVLENVILVASSDRLAVGVLNDCVNKRSPQLNGWDWGRIDVERLTKAYRDRMKAKYIPVGSASFFSGEGQPDIVPLGRWALCGSEGRSQAHECLLSEFNAKHSNLGKFLSLFFISEVENELSWPGRKDPLVTIQEIYFPLKEIVDLLNVFQTTAYTSADEERAIIEFKSRYEARIP